VSGDDDAGEPYEDDNLGCDAQPCERMKHVLGCIQLNNAINGVIRAAALARTALVADYFSSDIVLMAELALHGKFVQVPEELFYRRMTPDSSTKLKSDDERTAYYQPVQRPRMLFQHWRLHRGYFAAATRAPLPLNERLCAYAHLTRRALWHRHALASDVLLAIRAALGAKR
jgi:hypothetical protein